MSVAELRKYTFVSKYAQFKKDKQRRETWHEAVERVRRMMLDVYPQVEDEINYAYDLMERKYCLGSQRVLQFAGPSVLKHHMRAYNCTSSYIDRLRFFQEAFYILLCGAGAGYSVQKHHVAKLPPLIAKGRTYSKSFIIEDTIEGWADSVGVLLSSYFENDLFPEYLGRRVDFDFSKIRPAGSEISSGIGKAPGPEPLQRALLKIQDFLDSIIGNQTQLRPIQAYDITCFLSDAVLSGGVRRCLAKGQKVLVKTHGYKNIEDVQIGDLVSTPEGWQPVTNIFNQGIQETIRIVHQDGELVCTPNHRLAVLNGIDSFEWKEARHLQKDDRLFFIRNIASGTKTTLPEFSYVRPEHSTTCKDITIPELDEHIAWFLGIFQGNGYVYLTEKAGQICVAIHGDERPQANLIKSIIERFGVNATIREPRIDDHCFKIVCKSKQLATYFYEFLKQPKTTLHIPRCIVEGAQSIRAAFLQGVLDSDGSVKTHPQQPVCSIYPEFIKELQALYASLGIVVRIRKLSPSQNPNWHQRYGLVIVNNYDKQFFNNISKIGFKKYKLGKLNRNGNQFKGEWFENIKRPKYFRRHCVLSAPMTVDTYNKLYGHNRYVPVAVKRIETGIAQSTYDIEVKNDHCFICENVLVHNSSTIALFSPDDEEMIYAKTGDWFYKNRQRARSNNSAMLLRKETSFEDFNRILQAGRQNGDPGFVFTDSLEFTNNPCAPPDSGVLIRGLGLAQFRNINIGDYIWSKHGWTKVTNKWSTGIKKVYKYVTTGGTFYSTDNHRVVCRGQKIEVKDAPGIDTLTGEYAQSEIRQQIVMDGLVVGDGTAKTRMLNIGKNDQDYFNSEISHLIHPHREGVSEENIWYRVDTNINGEELPKTFLRRVPDRYKFADRNVICSFLRGLYTANGSLCGGRVTLKSASRGLIEDVQLMLSAVGIRSYYTTNKTQTVKFSNGDYVCKESYDLNITGDKDKFAQSIGFIQKYKTEKLAKLVSKSKPSKKPKITFDIISSELHSEEEVFDITVDNETHTFWCYGFDISNCIEVNKFPRTKDGRSGWQCCNLSTGNGSKVKSKQDFLDISRACAIFGTLQAGFTDFPYVGAATEEITRREALLGVSFTGWMENPDIMLDPGIQREAAQVAVQTNTELAKKIGINPAARVTCCKPDGSTSCLLGTSSGIHPHHAKRYFRRVQANVLEPPAQHFMKMNPEAVEISEWGESGTDLVLNFCIEVDSMAKTKNDVSALELLKIVKLTQNNWVNSGKTVERCSHPDLKHAVSNTIHIKDGEWDEVGQYIYDNRDSFTAISFIANSGDKDFVQAPFTAVYTPHQILKEYGEGAMFASGLIEGALKVTNNKLWDACNMVLGLLDYNVEQNLWVVRVKKFADKYLEGDLRKTTYLLKDVYNWKLWVDLKREYQAVNYEECIETEDNTKLEQNVACAGGACEI